MVSSYSEAPDPRITTVKQKEQYAEKFSLIYASKSRNIERTIYKKYACPVSFEVAMARVNLSMVLVGQDDLGNCIVKNS